MRTCKKCGRDLSEGMFNDTPRYRVYECKNCKKVYMNQWRKLKYDRNKKNLLASGRVPKRCMYCPMKEKDNGHYRCVRADRVIDNQGVRADWCPLAQVMEVNNV